MVSLFFVLIFRKYDDSNDFAYDHDDTNESLNPDKSWLGYKKKRGPHVYMSKFDEENLKLSKDRLQAMKEKRLLEKKLFEILVEITLYVLFLLVLYVVTFTNTSTAAMQYTRSFKNTFVTNSLTDVCIFKHTKE